MADHDDLLPGAFWYKSDVIYEQHVRAVHDSDDNGIGDFRGLVQKLDYLKDLGVTALWLPPFRRSPLKDEGCDLADYYDGHPMSGPLADFKEFLPATHLQTNRKRVSWSSSFVFGTEGTFEKPLQSKPR